MKTIGYPDPLHLVVVGERLGSRLSALQRAVVWDAIDRTGLAPDTIGVLAADGDDATLAEAGRRGHVRVVPVGREGDRGFELAHGDDFARHLEDAGARIAKVGLSWNPGHPPDDKKAQAMQLAKLAAWLHETDRELLVELEVPAVDDDLEQVGQDADRFRSERHPELVRRSVQEIRELGAEPDLWIVGSTGRGEEAAELAEVVTEAGRAEVGILVGDDSDDPALRTAAKLTGYRGFVVGRSVLAGPLASLDAGGSTSDEAVDAIERAIARRLELADPPAPG